MNNCRRLYQIAYFLSSTLVTYLLLSIATFQYHNVTQEIGFYFFIVMTMISALSSVFVVRGIKDILNYSKTLGTQEVEVKPLNAISSSIMFNEIIVPITFVALAFDRSTVTTLFLVVLYQFCQYQVYKGNGFMPNLTLELVGLSTYEVISSTTKDSRLEYVFARKRDLDVGKYGTAVNFTDGEPTIGVIIML